MYNKIVINRIAEQVRSRLSDDVTGHDWWHTYRVLGLANHLWKEEGGDRYVIELGALLHEIAD